MALHTPLGRLAIAIQPDFPQAGYGKACCYALQQQKEPALATLREALRLEPEEYRGLAKTNPEFTFLHQEPQFIATIESQ